MMKGSQQIKEQYQHLFQASHVEELEALEAALRFPHFTSQDALQLGLAVVEQMSQVDGEIAIRITRESDQLAIFQYVMDAKRQRNLDFGEAKRQTVLKTGHCSLWALAKASVSGGLVDIFSEESPCLPVGGAFPIYVGDELVATIFVSGLHEGLDHMLLVQAMQSFLGVAVPPYHGAVI